MNARYLSSRPPVPVGGSGERPSTRPVAAPAPDRVALLREIDAMNGPGLAKTLPTAKELREKAEEEAAALFDSVLAAHKVPTRDAARIFATHPSTVDNARKNHKSPTLWMLIRLPRKLRLQILRDLMLSTPEVDLEFTGADDSETSRGLRRVG